MADGQWKPYVPPSTAQRIWQNLKYYLSLPFLEAQWYIETGLQVLRTAAGHTKILFAKNEVFVSYGFAYERAPEGYLFPHRRTHARMSGIDSLRIQYPWANTLEELIFLEGFDKGEEYALRIPDIPKKEDVDPQSLPI
jgi:hypothetical protein